MDSKKILYISIVSLVVLILGCVLLSGLLDGFWPWESGKAPGSDYTGINTSQNTTDSSTQDNTGNSEENAEGGNQSDDNGVVDEDFSINVDIENNGNFGEIDFDDLLPDSDPTTKPTTPGETTKPTTPGETTKPTTPGETTKPTTPGETTKPTTPGETTEPTYSGNAAPADPDEGDIELPF